MGAGKDFVPGVFDWHRGERPPCEEISDGVFRLTWEGLPDGVFYLPGFLTVDEQLRVAIASLEEYIEPPNRRNLDAHEKLSEGDLRDLWRARSPLLSKLRWSTLGCHYDWGARVYHKERTTFPEPLTNLVRDVLRPVGIDSTPEAAIVNFYHASRPSDRLGGHLDDVESANTRPLVSLSLGLPAVFLLGGKTRAVKPEGLMLRSGDVLVLTGDARLLYHGVPCVLRESLPEGPLPSAPFSSLSPPSARADGWGFPKSSDDVDVNDEDSVAGFLRRTRVNLSIREVANVTKGAEEKTPTPENRKRSREN